MFLFSHCLFICYVRMCFIPFLQNEKKLNRMQQLLPTSVTNAIFEVNVRPANGKKTKIITHKHKSKSYTQIIITVFLLLVLLFCLCRLLLFKKKTRILCGGSFWSVQLCIDRLLLQFWLSDEQFSLPDFCCCFRLQFKFSSNGQFQLSDSSYVVDGWKYTRMRCIDVFLQNDETFFRS